MIMIMLKHLLGWSVPITFAIGIPQVNDLWGWKAYATLTFLILMAITTMGRACMMKRKEEECPQVEVSEPTESFEAVLFRQEQRLPPAKKALLEKLAAKGVD